MRNLRQKQPCCCSPLCPTAAACLCRTCEHGSTVRLLCPAAIRYLLIGQGSTDLLSRKKALRVHGRVKMPANRVLPLFSGLGEASAVSGSSPLQIRPRTKLMRLRRCHSRRALFSWACCCTWNRRYTSCLNHSLRLHEATELFAKHSTVAPLVLKRP